MARDPLAADLLSGKRRSRQAKRRFDVVLNNQGAEMRLPSIPRVRIGWRLASFALAAFLIVALYQLWTSPDYQVEAAEVFGIERLAASDINAVLGVSGLQVFEISPDEMEQELLDSFPEIFSASVMVDFPQTVVVTVTERTPVLTWRQDSRIMLVDETGWAYPARDEAGSLLDVSIEAQNDPPPLPPTDLPLPLPVLLNPEEEDEKDLEETKPYIEAVPFLSRQMVETILYLAQQAPAGAVLTYDSQHGLGWQDTRNWVVYFGDSQDIPMKLVVYQSILDHLMSADTLPVMISVEYVHAPYYRLEQ
jgi:hypothetical protein